jgi:hypothetical protein
MDKGFRIIFETYDVDDPHATIDRSLILEDVISKPTNCFDFSLEHEKQIELIQISMDKIIAEKAKLINTDYTICPECGGKIKKYGANISTFHDIFTDHSVKIQRLSCAACQYEPPSTIRTLLNGVLSGALMKMQSELGATYTFRDCEELLQKFSTKSRSINNHNRVKIVTMNIGNEVSKINHEETQIFTTEEADELIINIDGGHVKTTENQRSIEALTAVIYRPEALISNQSETRNFIVSKNCSASVKDDGQKEMITNTIVAALKQGLTPNTRITALCDGATNCWNVVEMFRPISGGVLCILDWFHISMKMENIALPNEIRLKFLRIKWHLWRGHTEMALQRIQQLISCVDSNKIIDKLQKFQNYIQNNVARIVNYRSRKLKGLVFTSNLAESTVESLVNQRCKGQQHMRWSREGLNPILQLRAAIFSKDWDSKWKMVVLNAIK